MLLVMSEQTTPQGRAQRAPLRRDRRSKVIAGVCGGLGRHLDIDPVVFRILFGVLTFIGGIGLLAYAAAWLFVPLEGADRSEGHRLLNGSNPLMAVVVAVGLAVGALATVSAVTDGINGLWPVWLIAAAVAGVLIWRGDIKLGRGPAASGPRQPPTWWQQPVAGEAEFTGQPAAGSAAPPVPPETGAQPQDAAPEGYPGAAGPSSWVDLGRLGRGGAGAGYGFEAFAPEPANAPPRRRRGYGGLVLAGLLAATGVVGVLDAARLISLSWVSGGALVLLLLGVGMTVGGLFGKTTGLVPIGIVLAVPLIVLAAIGVPLRGPVGDVRWSPATAADLKPRYQLAVGDADLDLSALIPGAGKTVSTVAQVGVGDLSVQVPTDVNVQVDESSGIGSVSADNGTGEDQGADGIGGAHRSFTIPAQGRAQGTIVLNLKTGIGDVDVEAGS
jgi:phage shock protein PspC (stress-responsive transcriptional regulator)